MSNPWIVLVVTAALIAFTAFFVIIEFALLGARRHRLEASAATSRSARAALKAVNELTVMLAGAQLGITASTFALGAVTKPAVDAWLSPLLAGIGLPMWLADGGSFVLSLLIVTFLHLVVGEMAPKSWAIAHPEKSALLVSLPARAFIWVFRPLLIWVNNIANRLVKASGVEPVESAAVGGQDAATIRHLVEHSAHVGALDATMRTPISGALDLERLKVEDLISEEGQLSSVSSEATVREVQKATEQSGHKRILVMDGEKAPLVVHVRDTLLEPMERSAKEIARTPCILEAGTLVYEGLMQMRQSSEQLAVVMDGSKFVGIMTFNDALNNMLPAPGEEMNAYRTAEQ